MNGYNNKILYINLTKNKIEEKIFDEKFARSYLGGNGFGAKIIYEASNYADIDPLSEENIMVIATGPMTNSPMWGSSRGQVISISPQTGYLADSNFGGDFAHMLKKTGFDAIVITGKATTPSYISIIDGKVKIKGAEKIWGKNTSQTHEALVEMENQKIESAVIGPAGENQVVFANIICSGKRVSAAGRCGFGAVFGSKNVKGITVFGNCSNDIYDSENLKRILKENLPLLKENTGVLTKYGTPVLVNILNEKGMLGTKNYTRETFDKAHNISGEIIEENYKTKNTACNRCPVACGKMVKVTSGSFAGKEVKMPEYETIYALGSMLENDNINSIFNANNMCDEMGLDTISMGVTLAFTAECYEKGLIDENKLDGKVIFNGLESYAELVKETAYKKNAGKLLSLGSEKLSQHIGKDSWKLLYSVKGLEIAGHSARALRQLSLGYAVSTRGGSHHDTRPKYLTPEVDTGFEKQHEYCFNSEHFTAVGDSLVLCRFVMERTFGSYLNTKLCSVLNSITGWDIDEKELNTIGERIYNLERLINSGRGLKREKDTLPYRVKNEPIPDGAVKGRFCSEENLNKMLDSYYQLRGWDNQGIPTEKKLIQLGIV